MEVSGVSSGKVSCVCRAANPDALQEPSSALWLRVSLGLGSWTPGRCSPTGGCGAAVPGAVPRGAPAPRAEGPASLCCWGRIVPELVLSWPWGCGSLWGGIFGMQRLGSQHELFPRLSGLSQVRADHTIPCSFPKGLSTLTEPLFFAGPASCVPGKQAMSQSARALPAARESLSPEQFPEQGQACAVLHKPLGRSTNSASSLGQRSCTHRLGLGGWGGPGEGFGFGEGRQKSLPGMDLK